MNALMSFIFSAWTVAVAVIFAGVVWWAYSARRSAEFAAAAHLPLEADEDDVLIPEMIRSKMKEQV
jgi:cytochrome c oxidase cbb3-type subunit 4